MEYMQLFLWTLCWLGLVCHNTAGEQSGTQIVITTQVCNMGTFNATCRAHEVILVQTARYGRMELSRCVQKDLGYLGCAGDVLPFLDSRCSGRHQCSFSIPDPALYRTQACPADTTSYLEVTYTCIKVTQVPGARCRSGRVVPVPAPAGFLSSELTAATSLGTAACPWRLKALPGQRLNFTVYNFRRGVRDGGAQADSGDGDCYEYATFVENGKRKRMAICTGERRKFHFYLSRSHTVDIHLVDSEILKSHGQILLKFEASGCGDLDAPRNGYVQRNGDNAEVRCNHTNEVWFLTCKGTAWLGRTGNCSAEGAYTGIFTDSRPFPYGILIVVAIGVALGVFLGGLLLLLAIVYMKRRQRRRDAISRQRSLAMDPGPLDTPDWNRQPKLLEPGDTLLRDQAVLVPSYCERPAVHVATLRRDKRGPPLSPQLRAHYAGAGDPMRPEMTRQHIYECPRFTS